MLEDCLRVRTNVEWTSGKNGRYIKKGHLQDCLRRTRGLGIRSAPCLVWVPPEEDGPGSRSVRTDVRCPSKDGWNRSRTVHPIVNRGKSKGGTDGYHNVTCGEERSKAAETRNKRDSEIRGRGIRVDR